MEQVNWLIPFKGFNPSGSFNLNFLYQEKNVYVMDNHRAALWCWYQNVDLSRKYSILHIDRHSDAVKVNNIILDKLPSDIFNEKIDIYLNCEFSKDIPLISWDNYLSIFLALHPSLIENLIMAIYEGSLPKPAPQVDLFNDYLSENNVLAIDKSGEQFDFNGDLTQLNVSELLCNTRHFLEKDEWIVNIDLDYFFCESNEGVTRMITDEYIYSLFDIILKKLNDGAIKTLTIALSPECSGGWKNSVDLCNKISKHMGLSFNLDYVSDDEYLRSIDGMVQSIQEARKEPHYKGVTLDKLKW